MKIRQERLEKCRGIYNNWFFSAMSSRSNYSVPSFPLDMITTYENVRKKAQEGEEMIKPELL